MAGFKGDGFMWGWMKCNEIVRKIVRKGYCVVPLPK